MALLAVARPAHGLARSLSGPSGHCRLRRRLVHKARHGWVADRRDRTRQPQDPSEHRRRRQDPRDLTAVPRTARRIKSGATACALPICGPDPRTSEWRSADPRRSDAVLAYLSPATTRPASTTGEHQKLLTGGFPLDVAIPYQKVSASGMASAAWPITGCVCCCTAASAGILTAPQDCEPAPHVSWRRAPLLFSDPCS